VNTEVARADDANENVSVERRAPESPLHMLPSVVSAPFPFLISSISMVASA
jgi:hypothetical protein